jgi:hypothetical protein
MDLRHGGGMVAQLARTVLRWAAPMLDMPGMDEPGRARLHAVFGVVAHRAAWAAFDVAAHEPARSLFRLALHAAAVAGEHDLRAHVLADVAAQHNQLGYRQDALEVVRLAEGDDRIAPAVRMVLHGVKARTYPAAGQAGDCHRQVELAEAAFAGASQDEPGWVGRLASPARLYAATGHALAELYAAAGAEGDRREAARRLGRAGPSRSSTPAPTPGRTRCAWPAWPGCTRPAPARTGTPGRPAGPGGSCPPPVRASAPPGSPRRPGQPGRGPRPARPPPAPGRSPPVRPGDPPRWDSPAAPDREREPGRGQLR